MQQEKIYDLIIVGGGINGAGIARDAAGRGLSVLLLEAGDLAQATSSGSTKLIHGGLRYLEYYDFTLVRKALKEREALMKIAPHIIWPLDFVLPHAPHLRPRWMIRTGLFLYDMLGGRKTLPGSKSLNLLGHDFGKPIKGDYAHGFSYADCWVEDSRLVVLNAMDAARNKAEIRTKERVVRIRTVPDYAYWRVETQYGAQYHGRLVVNASGPWASALMRENGFDADEIPDLRLVRGSHIIVPRLFDGDQCYILQNDDQRIVFAIPYERDYTLIGTTDEDMGNDPDVAPVITQGEAEYLVNAVNDYFVKQLSLQDIVSAYSAVRPLIEEEGKSASAVTRDYRLQMAYKDNLPVLNVLGGKITTYRQLADEALPMIERALGLRGSKSWTATKPLPGGDIPGADFNGFLAELHREFADEPKDLVTRYARAYGTLAPSLLAGDKGREIAPDVFEVELDHMIRREWAISGEDALWRRSKLALHLDTEEQRRINIWMETHN